MRWVQPQSGFVDHSQLRNTMPMPTSRSIAVPNALILISDLDGGVPPDVMGRSLIASTSSCIAVGCMSDSNGKTEVIIGAAQEVDPRDSPAFVGELETRNRAIVVRTVLREPIVQA